VDEREAEAKKVVNDFRKEREARDAEWKAKTLSKKSSSVTADFGRDANTSNFQKSDGVDDSRAASKARAAAKWKAKKECEERKAKKNAPEVWEEWKDVDHVNFLNKYSNMHAKERERTDWLEPNPNQSVREAHGSNDYGFRGLKKQVRKALPKIPTSKGSWQPLSKADAYKVKSATAKAGALKSRNKSNGRSNKSSPQAKVALCEDVGDYHDRHDSLVPVSCSKLLPGENPYPIRVVAPNGGEISMNWYKALNFYWTSEDEYMGVDLLPIRCMHFTEGNGLALHSCMSRSDAIDLGFIDSNGHAIAPVEISGEGPSGEVQILEGVELKLPSTGESATGTLLILDDDCSASPTLGRTSHARGYGAMRKLIEGNAQRVNQDIMRWAYAERFGSFAQSSLTACPRCWTHMRCACCFWGPFSSAQGRSCGWCSESFSAAACYYCQHYCTGCLEHSYCTTCECVVPPNCFAPIAPVTCTECAEEAEREAAPGVDVPPKDVHAIATAKDAHAIATAALWAHESNYGSMVDYSAPPPTHSIAEALPATIRSTPPALAGEYKQEEEEGEGAGGGNAPHLKHAKGGAASGFQLSDEEEWAEWGQEEWAEWERVQGGGKGGKGGGAVSYEVLTLGGESINLDLLPTSQVRDAIAALTERAGIRAAELALVGPKSEEYLLPNEVLLECTEVPEGEEGGGESGGRRCLYMVRKPVPRAFMGDLDEMQERYYTHEDELWNRYNARRRQRNIKPDQHNRAYQAWLQRGEELKAALEIAEADLEQLEQEKKLYTKTDFGYEFRDLEVCCFGGEGWVRVAGGATKRVRDVLAGDEIMTASGLQRVMLVTCDEVGHEIQMCEVNGLWLTPEHPIRSDGVWHLPKQLVPPCQRFVDRVYNFELDAGHVALINDVEVICLGDPDVIPLTDPAYSADNNRLWSSGWLANPRRGAYYTQQQQQQQQHDQRWHEHEHLHLQQHHHHQRVVSPI
jgi:hypothetical protein